MYAYINPNCISNKPNTLFSELLFINNKKNTLKHNQYYFTSEWFDLLE